MIEPMVEAQVDLMASRMVAAWADPMVEPMVAARA
jgi:hypothetical protein